ncbi:50S ribosomal protein L10 [Candidatus Parcubacteria bacterium]|nr:50S ribosomal protein L10 [Candidatus Parcubacteria bacterium]
MAKTRLQKKEMLDKLSVVAKEAGSAVFLSFNKLTVGEETELRKILRESETTYQVVKKSLLKKAVTDAGLEGVMPSIEGTVAIAYGQDLTAPAREVYEFSKKHKEQVSIQGGLFDGKIMSQIEMMEIATIPPTDQLRGMFVNIINSPIQRFVIALGQIAEKKA